MRSFIWPVFLIAVAVVASVWSYPELPAQVAIHWNVYGQPDGYGSRLFAAAFIPCIMVGVTALFAVLPKIDPRRENYASFTFGFRTIFMATLALLLVVHLLVLAAGLGYKIDASYVFPLVIGALFVACGNVMPTFRHNYFVGIRTPWTLASEDVWRKTHRVGGKLFFASGLLMIASSLLPNAFRFPAMIALIFVTAFSTFILSYLYYRKK